MIDVLPVEVPWEQSMIIITNALPIMFLTLALFAAVVFVISRKNGFRWEFFVMAVFLLIVSLAFGNSALSALSNNYSSFTVTQAEFKKAVENKYAISIDSFAHENEVNETLYMTGNSKIFYATDDNSLK